MLHGAQFFLKHVTYSLHRKNISIYSLRPLKSVHLGSKICPTKSVFLPPSKSHLIKSTLTPIKKVYGEECKANQMSH
jgi:hypothetical protein